MMQKQIFHPFRRPILASKINQQIMVFPTHFLDLIFPICFRFLSKMIDFGTSFKIKRSPKWVPKPTMFAKMSKSCMIFSGCGFLCSRPAFPEIILTTVPFGPSVFSKVIFSMQIGSFSVLSDFLCAICYITFLSLFCIIAQ